MIERELVDGLIETYALSVQQGSLDDRRENGDTLERVLDELYRERDDARERVYVMEAGLRAIAEFADRLGRPGIADVAREFLAAGEPSDV